MPFVSIRPFEQNDIDYLLSLSSSEEFISDFSCLAITYCGMNHSRNNKKKPNEINSILEKQSINYGYSFVPPELSRGTKPRNPERIAAKTLREIFDKYGIKYSANNWPDANCPAVKCLEIAFRISGVIKSPQTIIEYVKDSTLQETENGR